MRLKNFCLLPLLTFMLVFTGIDFAYSAEAWIQRARKVGQSETPAARDSALAALRKQKNLDAKLIKALDTSDRALALDAISALGLKGLVPELEKRVASDPDGFLILTLSSLIDSENKDRVLATYSQTLSESLEAVTPAAIVSMLEPLGRIGQTLSAQTIEKLSTHSFPEVRSALLYYLRAMALSHNKREHDPIILKASNSSEFQIRLQTISLIKELNGQSNYPQILSKTNLEKRCQKERVLKVKEKCLSFVRKGAA